MKEYIITYQIVGHPFGEFATVPLTINEWEKGFSAKAKSDIVLSGIAKNIGKQANDIIIINSLDLNP